MQRPADWPLAWRRPVVAAVCLLVLGAATSIWVRTASVSTDFGVDDLVVLAVVAAVSLGFVIVSRQWRIWVWQCLLAVIAWIIFLGPTGDLSCTDCGFALLIPLNLAAGQLALWLLALLIPTLRERPAGSDSGQ